MSAKDIAQAYLQAVYSQQFDTAAALLAHDIRLRMGGGGVLAGEYNGLEAFFGAFARMQEVTGGTYTMTEQIAWLGDDTRAVLLAREQAVRNETTYSFLRVIVYEVVDAKIRTIQVYEGDPRVADAAFAG